MAYNKQCGFCNREIIMDNKDGGWRPYNVNGSVHNCKTEQQKNDHGNEAFDPKETTAVRQQLDTLRDKPTEFVDHTVLGIAQIKSFSAPSTEILDKDVNAWLLSRGNTIRFRGGQWQMTEKEYGCACWYEETK